MAGNRTPKWHISAAIRTGEEVARLAVKHRQVLDPRLAPGLIDGLVSNTGLLRAGMMGQRTAYAEKEGATVTQNQAAKRGQKLALAIREAVKRGAASDKALQEEAIDALVGAAGLAFLEDQKTAELFANLIPSKSAGKKPVQIGETK